MAYFQSWAIAFLFTQMVEVPIYTVGLRVGLLPAFGASAITHPVLWFVIFPYLHLSYFWLIVIGEGFAFLAEAAYFAFLFRRRRALLWSALANTASFSTGMLSRWLFGIP
ncbi:MAG: hypothetical protein ABSF35_22435 [Polyangia bacterium]|jgi:hypothetical protein